MPPSFSNDHIANCRLTDVEHSANCSERNFLLRKKSYFQYRFGIQSGICISFPSSCNALLDSIGEIFLAGTQPQMVWVHANFAIWIRSAIMAYLQSLWNFSIGNIPRNDVGTNRLPAFHADAAIASATNATSPKPTMISLLDLRPESFLQRLWWATRPMRNRAIILAIFPTSSNFFGERLKRLLTVLADQVSITLHRFFLCFHGDAARPRATNPAASFLLA